MSKLTRRTAMLVAGALGVVPLLGAGPRRWRRECPRCCDGNIDSRGGRILVPDTILAKSQVTVIGDKLTVTLYDDTNPPNPPTPIVVKGSTSGVVQTVNIAYSPIGTTSQVGLLPWARDAQIWSLATYGGQPFQYHTFVLKIDTSSTPYSLRADCTSVYKGGGTNPSNCCFLCGGQHICVASGDCIMCNGIKMCC
jgi:hypothetical protein